MLEQILAITDTSAKYWQPFDVTSPGGIPFAGYLCRQESERLGMLAITEVDGQERLEFVYAMPKIHYPYLKDREGRPRVSISVPQNIVDARFTVKLDGTAIIFYPLTDAKGEILEVIPRTRLQPVLTDSRWGNWNGLLDEVLPDRSEVARAIRLQRVVLVFELWGYRNPHMITYATPLALTLHTAIRHRKPLSYRLLADLAQRHNFQLVETMLTAKPDAAGLAEAYRRLQASMEAHNQAAGEGKFLEEGAILVLSTAETAMYYKCKPPTIEEIHWAQGESIGKTNIEHTLYKMLENGYDFLTGSVEDLKRELESDFDPTEIEFAAELLERVYQDFVLEQQQRQWLRQLVDQSGLAVDDLPQLMRYLSQHYPKRQMGWVYATVKTLYGLGRE
ncbi:MAG: hypothetical protein R3C14_50160 [Caldilineaceae bacterium]